MHIRDKVSEANNAVIPIRLKQQITERLAKSRTRRSRLRATVEEPERRQSGQDRNSRSRSTIDWPRCREQ